MIYIYTEKREGRESDSFSWILQKHKVYIQVCINFYWQETTFVFTYHSEKKKYWLHSVKAAKNWHYSCMDWFLINFTFTMAFSLPPGRVLLRKHPWRRKTRRLRNGSKESRGWEKGAEVRCGPRAHSVSPGLWYFRAWCDSQHITPHFWPSVI